MAISAWARMSRKAIGVSIGSGMSAAAVKDPGANVKEPWSSIFWEKWAWLTWAWMRRYRSIAFDFQRPRSWIQVGSMLAHIRAVAPPGRRLRALRSFQSMPEAFWRSLALCRRPFVMKDAVIWRGRLVVLS